MSSVTLLTLRPARVAPTPGIGEMKPNDALVVLREKAKLVDNTLCHLLVASYRCDPARRLKDLEQHIEKMKGYGDAVPAYLSSQTRALIERADRGTGYVLDEERQRVVVLLFAMIALGGVSALALWYGVRRRAFTTLGLGTVAPFLLGVDEPTALIFCGHLGVIAILTLFAPDRPRVVAATRTPANALPHRSRR